jgi:C-terminal processing protease CtpA/Prc
MKTSLVHVVVIVVLIAMAVLIPLRVLGQQPATQNAAAASQPPDLTIDAAARTEVIDGIIKELNDGYVFPDVAKKIEGDLRARQKNKEYDAIVSARDFATKLTDDVQSVSHDKHMRVRYSPEPIPVRSDKTEPTEAEKAEFSWYMKRTNYAFNKVERMDGNIGYIELTNFFDPQNGADTVAAAFNFVTNTDALIIDLRRNGGGDPEMVQLICSYLFGDKPVHLNDLYFRADNKTAEFWTKPVSGKKYLDKDIYVLTSDRTFSGAEEFTYNLKNLKRSTTVGETTGGGANPGGVVRVSEHFGIFVPSGRAINPYTKTNWEGTGVEPDVKIAKELALKTAYLMALSKSVEKQTNPNIKAGMKELIEKTQKELDEMKKK